MKLTAWYHRWRGKQLWSNRMLDQALHHYSRLALREIPASDRVDYAMYFYEKEQTEKALAILNQIIEIEPANDYAYERRAHLLRELNQPELAMHDVSEAIRLNPDRYLYWYTRGLLFRDRGEWDKAAEDFQECIKREPESSVHSTYYELGMCCYDKEDFAEASRIFARLLEDRDKEIPFYYYRLALSLSEERKWSEAADVLKKGIALLDMFQAQPDQGRQWLLQRAQYGSGAFHEFQLIVLRSASFRKDLAELYERLEQYDAVAAACGDGLRLHPERPDLYVKRGMAYRHLKQWQAAEQDLDQAIELDPRYLEPYFEKALLYRVQGQEDKALDVLLALRSLKPELPLTHYWITDSYSVLQQHELALESSAKLIELEPDDPLNYTQRGEVLHELGRTSEALEAYGQSIALGDHSQTRMKRSYLYYLQDKNEEAMIDLQAAAELNPALLQEGSYHNALGHILQGMGQTDLAIDSYTQAIRHEPETASYYENRAKCYMETGEWDLAEEDCLNGLMQDNHNGDLISLLGSIYYLKEDYDEAYSYAKQYCSLYPEHAVGYFNIGVIRYKKGEHAAALKAFDKALMLNPYGGKSYLYKAHIYYDQLDTTACVDSIVNWNLFTFKEMDLEERLRRIRELDGLDEQTLELAVKSLEALFHSTSTNLN
ncbi:tetratricopeptide repeat protein [Paenibacillus senegalensis]|uniref:tetratricopeptide repeat protein n=1 Tax=Paenibacillus senegalensis TaxID=1465766 RepID=UPI000287F9A0|nr:tetratricopeptide repeat protein [Paenibacillus senegalensis]